MRNDGYCNVIKSMDLGWADQNWASQPARTLDWLKDVLLDQFGLGRRDWPQQFVDHIAKLAQVPVVCYHLHWENWNDSHLRTIKEWVLQWGALPALRLGYPIVVMIAVEHADARARFPFLRQSKSPAVEIAKFAELTSKDLLVVPLTQLGNIQKTDVEAWIREVVKPRDPLAMIRRFREVLDDPTFFAADGGGVPMSRFVNRAAQSGLLKLVATENAEGQRMKK